MVIADAAVPIIESFTSGGSRARKPTWRSRSRRAVFLGSMDIAIKLIFEDVQTIHALVMIVLDFANCLNSTEMIFVLLIPGTQRCYCRLEMLKYIFNPYLITVKSILSEMGC